MSDAPSDRERAVLAALDAATQERDAAVAALSGITGNADSLRRTLAAHEASADHRPGGPCCAELRAALRVLVASGEAEPRGWGLHRAVEERDEARRERAEAYTVIGHLGDALSEAGIEVSAVAQDYPAYVRQIAAERDALREELERAKRDLVDAHPEVVAAGLRWLLRNAEAKYESLNTAAKEASAEYDAELDALRAQVAELTRLGVSIHKAAAAAQQAQRDRIVAWLRAALERGGLGSDPNTGLPAIGALYSAGYTAAVGDIAHAIEMGDDETHDG
jgi:DNA repair exonuclease SbcCD ATPase subunit